MQLLSSTLKELFLKLVIFAAIFYIVIVAISILITSFLFLSLNSYKTRIENVIYHHTGYTLNVESIKTKLNAYYLPEIIINKVKLSNPSNVKQTFSVNRLEFVFSYSSLWNLEPIFKQINIDGTNINLEYLADGSIIFNGINLNHPDKKVLENTKNSPIDLENWILKQDSIKLSNINFSFSDKKHNLPQIELANVTTTLTNSYFHKHNLAITIGAKNSATLVNASLNWHGGKVTQFESWSEAQLKVQTYNNHAPLTGTFQQYLPEILVLHRFNAETALDAQIKKGKLQYLYANFDIKNFQYALKHSNNFISFPKLGGNLQINLVNDTQYKIEANNLTIATPDGYVFNNKQVIGRYNINQNGYLSVINTNLKNFNNFLVMLPIHAISVDGNLDIIKFSWVGSIFNLNQYLLYIRFNNLSISSKDEAIPSLNHISGDVSVTNTKGILNLALKNSTLNYKKVFLIPYKFKSLISKITWNINKDKTIDVILNPTDIETVDFKGNAYGKYIYTPGTIGYLDLTAHVDKVLISKVGDYLPKVIGIDVHQWLDMALIGGYGVNGNLELQGDLQDFPYANGRGKFYITANFVNGKLQYVKDWPTIDRADGTFAIRNEKILIMANGAQISGNKIGKSIITIPNMLANNVYLTADGVATGSTANFLHYLAQTPINDIIGKIPEKVTTSGNGNANLHLTVPFANPKHTSVSGFYNFQANQIKFNLPVPVLNNVNGKLYFTESGITIDQINAQALDSEATLSANTTTNEIIHFKVLVPNLDYQQVAKYYLPFISNLVAGRALTNIYFNINQNGIDKLNAKSNLIGVKLDVAKPLYKKLSSISSMNFTLSNNQSNFSIYFNYADLLFGNIFLNQHGQIKTAQLAIGREEFATDNRNQAKIMVNANLNDTYALDWLDMVKKIMVNNQPSSSMTTITNESTLNLTNTEQSESSILPIEILLNTDNFYLESTNFNKAYADILVTQDKTIFNINSVQTNGYGTYTYNLQQLYLYINDFNLRTTITDEMANGQSQKLRQEEYRLQILNAGAMLESLNNMPALKSISNSLKLTNESSIPNLDFPKIELFINHLYYENHNIGNLNVYLYPRDHDLIIESGEINSGNTAKILFSGTNYCMECGIRKSFVNMNVTATFTDLGALLESLNYSNIISKGNGTAIASIQWNGKLQDFDVTHATADININLKSGKFMKVNTGNILGKIIGLINLQTIINFAKLNFSSIFENGFYFSQLNMQASLLNDKIILKSLHMTGPMATVNSNGSIDIANDALNLYLSVIPNLGSSVAVGAALVTANPIVGIATYVAEWALGEPFNKLFALSFHVTGSLDKPDVKQIKVSKQIVNNVNSAIGN